MQIINELSGGLAAARGRSVERSGGESFADVFKKAATVAGQEKDAKAEKSASQIQQEKDAAIEAARQALLTELHDYLKKSPAEHIRDAVLKELGLSEESLAALPPEQRTAMEAEINERIREKLLGRKPESGQEEAAAQPIEQNVGEASATAFDAEVLRMALAGTSQAMVKAA
jgi:hypothetical protein